jgi:hypothetical protein
MYVASTDHYLTIFALDKKQQMSDIMFLFFHEEAQDNYQPQMAITENGNNIVVSSSDLRYHVIDISNPISPTIKQKGTTYHKKNITGIQLGPNDRYIIIVDEN